MRAKKIVVRKSDGTKIHETFITKPQLKIAASLGLSLESYTKALVEFEMREKDEDNAYGSEQAK